MKSNQFGRSMMEMLGVIAIIGILTVGGIAGYSKAMEKYYVNKKEPSFSGRRTPSTGSGPGAPGAPVADETSGSPGVLVPSKEGSI